MSVTTHQAVVRESPLQAVDHVFEALALEPNADELALSGDEVLLHLDRLAHAYGCSYGDLPPALSIMAETVFRRDPTLMYERGRFMDLLWSQRCKLQREEVYAG